MVIEYETGRGIDIGETPKTTSHLVLRCIDFRTNAATARWLARRGHADGSYHLFASAGASGNSSGFLEAASQHKPDLIKVIDHEDCGFYKTNGFYELFEADGHAPHVVHHHNLETLGSELHKLNTGTEYRYNLLPLNKKERKRHTCAATTIILGEPEIVKAASEAMRDLGLANNHDVIARPYLLSPRDESIWNDLEISLKLHKPKKIYIFDRNEANALALADSARQVAGHIPVEPKVIQLAA
ncbi:MAG: hypothetical protein UT84_C0003G0102 [Candidatus Curtissbacteria bacterium GW2011_GWA1_40_16]|uniref:Uncharacterized protein n=1 Tax=Candidatus Curtissbacteria bacterium GW2011_GWA1_40_16 TaxID=1618405 RepID=A0A0G0ULJ9_9BACT|nr:MAG: hypothetical protein UT84_C0003G0102 [Candidatus Curtissbacteria bacterium GW2011_GWA1_40_16]